MEKFTSLVAVFLLFSVCAQSQNVSENKNDVPVSVCELMRNKKKFFNRKIYVEGILEISAHHTTFVAEKPCGNYELILFDYDKNFIPTAEFQSASDLFNLIIEYSKFAKNPTYTFIYTTVVKLKIDVEGIFKPAKRSDFLYRTPHYKFLATNIKTFGKSDLFVVTNIDKPPLISVDFNNPALKSINRE